MRSSLFSILFLLITPAVFSQVCTNNRYRERVFPQVTKTADIQYATVQTLPAVYLNETQTISQNLYLDVWQPTGDTLQKRPLVILAFGGAFLIGTKNDADIQAACDSLAHLGYVTASIQYRLGLNPTVASSGERAVYRATQDFSAAVRYFKQFASTYKIDTSAIFVGGASAGSFAALHMVYGDEDERPASSFASGGLFPAPDLGCMDCSGNNYPYSHKVRGVLNMWGALGFLNWMEPGDPPIVSFHGNSDPVVPFSEGFPFTVGATLPYVYGSEKITQKAQQLGIYNEFYPFSSAIHQLWGAGLEQNWVVGPTEFQVPILNGIREFMFKILKPAHSSLSGPSEVCTGAEVLYTVPFRPGFKYCWQVQNGQVVQQNNNQLLVKWNFAGNGQVSVREFNQNDIPADSFLVKQVNIFQTPNVQLSGPSSVCLGDTIQLIATGADSLVWSPQGIISPVPGGLASAWPSQQTVFSVTGYAVGNCSDADQHTVAVNPLPVSPIITRFDSVLFVPQQFAAYQWYLNGVAIPGATSNELLISSNGVYTVAVFNAAGCDVLSYPQAVANMTIQGFESSSVAIFPNPSDGFFTISGLAAGSYTVSVYGVNGTEVLAQQAWLVTDGTILLNGDSWIPGYYILHLSNELGNVFRIPLIRK